MKHKILLISLLFISFAAFTFGQPWKLIKNENGINIYSKIDKNSSIKIIKAETEAKATCASLVFLICDTKNQPNWVYGCKKAEILKKIDVTHWYYYSQTDTPWPVSNRDVVSFVSISQNEKTKVVTIKSVSKPEFIPQKPGYVRIPELISYWILKPLGEGKIKIIFQIKIDIGGIIPQWVTNMFVAKGPLNTVRNLLFEIEKPKYKDAVCKIVTELDY